MENSKIEWCHHTVNFVWGCVEVSPACANCYARTLDKIRGPLFDGGRLHWGADAPRWVKGEAATVELFRLDRRAAKAGERHRVFINSMSDTFEDHPALPPARAALWKAAELVTNLDLLLLTKRPDKIRQMVPAAWLQEWPAHVWIGTTVEDQVRADERIPHLLQIPAKVRFLSCEPLLGPLDLYNGDPDPRLDGHRATRTYLGDWWEPGDDLKAPSRHGVDWIIVGGESGSKARQMPAVWAQSLRDQCEVADVPFFMKQGSQANWDDFKKFATFPADLQVREFPATT